MKKILVLASAALVLAGCSTPQEPAPAPTTPAATSTTTTQETAPTSTQASSTTQEATSVASTSEPLAPVDVTAGTGIYSDGSHYFFCNQSPYTEGMPAASGECAGPMSQEEAQAAKEEAMKLLEPSF